MAFNLSMVKRQRPLLMAVGAPGHVPVPSGCKRCKDCFTCSFADCKAADYEVTGGNVTYEEAYLNGLRRQAYRIYMAGHTVREVAAIMKEPAIRVNQWIWNARKAGETG